MSKFFISINSKININKKMSSHLIINSSIIKENNESNFKLKTDKKKDIFLDNLSQKEKNLILFPKIDKIQNKNIPLKNNKKKAMIFELNINFPFNKQKLNHYLQELKNFKSQKNLSKDLNNITPILHIENLVNKKIICIKQNIEEEIIFQQPLLRFENLKKKEVMEKIFFKEINKLKKFWNDKNFNYPFIFRKIEKFNDNETIDISHKEILINKNK